MAFFRVMAMNGGGGGGDTSNDVVIKGTGVPTAQIGENGQIYLSCTSKDLSDVSTKNESSMSISKKFNSVNFSFRGGASIGAQAYMQLDLTDIRTISVTVYGHDGSYDNYSTLRFSPIFIIENTVNPATNYVSNTVTQSATGETYRIATVGDKRTFVADVSQLTGNYYLVFSSSGATSDFTDLVIDNRAVFVGNTYAKVNGAWQDLIGTEIEDIALKYKGAMGGTDVPASSLGEDGDIYYQYTEYTQSIKSLDFTQGYVFLPVEGKSNTRFVMNFKMTGGGNYAGPLGSRVSSNSNNFIILTKYNGANNGYYRVNSADTSLGSTDTYFNKDLILDMSNEKVILTDGVNSLESTPVNTTYFRSYRMCVGAVGTGDSAVDSNTYCEMNFYSLDAYENGTLIGRFIPAQDNDTDGLLEVFSNKFYAKTGTVSSTALATPIHNKVVSKVYVKIDGTWELLKGADADDVKNARTPKQDRTLANFDFTDSLTDIVDGRTATLSGATRDSDGITIDSATELVSFDPALLRIDTTYEIKFGTVNLTPGANTHSRLFTYTRAVDTSIQPESGFIFHYQTQKWGVWDAINLWQDSDISDINYFNNATLKIYIDIDGNWHFYKDDVLFFETTTPLPIDKIKSLRFGSETKSCWTCTIQSFKVISPWGTEFDKTETSMDCFHVERYNGDPMSDSIVMDRSSEFMLWTVTHSDYLNTYDFKINGASITSELSANVISTQNVSAGFGDTATKFWANKGDVLSWNVSYDNRAFTIFNLTPLSPEDVEIKTYLQLNSNGLLLPYTINADYKVTVNFVSGTYIQNEAIIDSTDTSSAHLRLVAYGNRWYMSEGTAQSPTVSWSAGEHTLINNINGYNKFDDVDVQTYTPTTANYKIGIGRGYTGSSVATNPTTYFKSFKIESIANGNEICSLVPAIAMGNHGFYDTVNNVFYRITDAVASDAMN